MKARDYPYHIPIEVVFHDLDAMGHVNNATYFVYMETVRVKYCLDELAGEIPPISMVAVEACCAYHAPAFRGELLTVATGISRFGNTSFEMLYRIDAPDRLVLTGKTVQVAYDYEAQRPTPVPPEFVAAVRDYQGGWQAPTE